MKLVGPKNIQIPYPDQKVPWQGIVSAALTQFGFFFASGAYEFLAMMDGKIREGPFFRGSIR